MLFVTDLFFALVTITPKRQIIENSSLFGYAIDKLVATRNNDPRGFQRS